MTISSGVAQVGPAINITARWGHRCKVRHLDWAAAQGHHPTQQSLIHRHSGGKLGALEPPIRRESVTRVKGS